MARWILILIMPLAFLSFQDEAGAQYYKSTDKEGSISFSDEPTSSIFKKDPAKKRISDKESTPALTQKETDELLNPDLMELSLPGKNWALEFNFKGFQVQYSGILPDFKGRSMTATNGKSKVILSVSLGLAQRQLSNKELRDHSWERLIELPAKREEVKKYEMSQWAILEYIVKEVKGSKDLNQKNVLAYLVKDNTWIDFQLSKVFYTPADDRFFKDFVAAAKILGNFIPSSIDNFQYGNHYFSNKNYEKAIVYYKKALEQEKKKPRLLKAFWLVLVDNLGMAYGLSGDLEMAKKTIQYGVSKDPTYPMFYYNLACTYAQLNDLEHSLLNLEKAGRYKANMISGEKWPEPAKDHSFQRFLKNEKFVEAAEKFPQ